MIIARLLLCSSLHCATLALGPIITHAHDEDQIPILTLDRDCRLVVQTWFDGEVVGRVIVLCQIDDEPSPFSEDPSPTNRLAPDNGSTMVPLDESFTDTVSPGTEQSIGAAAPLAFRVKKTALRE